MSKKNRSTYETFVSNLSSEQKKEFDAEHEELLLSELVLAIMENDEISVRELAKMAGVSPTIIQSIRAGRGKSHNLETFYKVMKSLGYDQFLVGKNGHFVSIDFSNFVKK